MSLFHRQKIGRKQASPTAMRGIIIFTSAFLAVSGVACSSSQENVKGGGNMVGSAMKEDLLTRTVAKKYDLENIVPIKMDTLVLSPKAKKLVEERIKQLKEEGKKIKMPGVDKDAAKPTHENIVLAFREDVYNGCELFLYYAAQKGNKKEVNEMIDEIMSLGTEYKQHERSENIIKKFYEIIKTE